MKTAVSHHIRHVCYQQSRVGVFGHGNKLHTFEQCRETQFASQSEHANLAYVSILGFLKL